MDELQTSVWNCEFSPKNTLLFGTFHQRMESWHLTYKCQLSNCSVFLSEIHNFELQFAISPFTILPLYVIHVCICIPISRLFNDV